MRRAAAYAEELRARAYEHKELVDGAVNVVAQCEAIAEAEALLDVFTSGAFSRMMAESIPPQAADPDEQDVE